MAGDEETVTIPINKLPPEFVKEHLEFNKDAVETTKQLKGDVITKKAAAVEVVRQMENLKFVSIIGIAALWISLLGGLIYEFLSIGGVLIGTGLIAFFYMKSEQEKRFLIGKYLRQIYREQHATNTATL